MLVNAADMLKKAEAGKYALGAFNTNNLEWTLAILQAAEEAKSPLILQCTAGAAKWMGGFKVCADMVKAAVEARALPFPSPFTSITVLTRTASSASSRLHVHHV